ncbi:hypothetical protein [Roseinatronobacter monicus]|uniref:hypothetical protein n=1 Tax=Roseinatronobacter monicus TaxID=393481 RepID=UPI003F39D1CB
MSRLDYFHQGGTPFDGFLYAELGQDRVGNTVSVLSALARLGRDPWDEAADLSALSSEGARKRLAGTLGRFHDVPAYGQDSGATIMRLVALLPSASNQKASTGTDLTSRVKALGFGPVFAVLTLIWFLVQTFVIGSDGSGD